MKKNGFTLVELLAVIVVLGAILAIAIPNIIKILDNTRQNVYKEYEKELVNSTKNYTVENIKMLPKQINEKTKITLQDLQSKDYVEEIKNPKNESEKCVGYIEVEKIATGDYNYSSYIRCGNDYMTTGYDESKAYNLKVSFGGDDKDEFKQLVKVNDGYIAVGNSSSCDNDLVGIRKQDDVSQSDAIIVKYGFDGNMIWKKTFGGEYDDYFNSIINVSDGVIAAGYSYSESMDMAGLNKGSSDGIIVKYDLDGNVVWKKTFGGTGDETFYKIINVTDGYIAVGEGSSNDLDLAGLNKGGWDAIIVKYDLNGNVSWKKTFGGTGWDTYYAVASQANGYIAVGHGASANGDLTGLSNYGAIIVKYDLNGNIVWKKTYGSGSIYNYFMGVVDTTDGCITVGSNVTTTGDLAGLNKGGADATVVKYDLNGNIVWKKNFGGSGYDWFESIYSTAGGYIAIGNSTSNDYNLRDLNKGKNDATIAKYDTNGNIVWNKNYGGSSDDYFNSLVEVGNNFIIVGKSWSYDGDMLNLDKGWYDGILFTVDSKPSR
jgi:prepilin-type N-terminal cleavage/methylation domain-containing protein